MVVRHVHEVSARGQHVAPGTEVRLDASFGAHPKHHRDILPRDDAGGRERQVSALGCGTSGSIERSTGDARISGTPSTNVIPHRGHLPAWLDRTSGSIGQ